MGGQFDYCGIWLAADFSHGHSKAGPLCTTYMSPRLSKREEFTIDHVEGIGTVPHHIGLLRH